MSQAQVEEAERAREQARLAAEKFEKIRQAQMAQHGELPAVPRGRPAEMVPHRRIEVARLERKMEMTKPLLPAVAKREVRIVRQKPSKRAFFRRPRIFGGRGIVQPVGLTGVRLREGTPANISRAEKDKALTRLDAAIGEWSRKYTFRVVHGAPPQKQNEAASKLRTLMAQKEAIEAMKPLGVPEHIRRAERWES